MIKSNTVHSIVTRRQFAKAFVGVSAAAAMPAVGLSIPAFAGQTAAMCQGDKIILEQSARISLMLVERVKLANDKAAASFVDGDVALDKQRKLNVMSANQDLRLIDKKLGVLIADLKQLKPVGAHANKAQRDSLGACLTCMAV